jgi:hypothetical protein
MELAYLLAVGRAPTALEREAMTQFLTRQRAIFAGAEDGDSRVWSDLCQMIFASNAFLYVE